MTLLDPKQRSERGRTTQAAVLATATDSAARQPDTIFDASWQDYVYAEVWTRPDLDHRARYLISISSAASAADATATLAYTRGALANGELSVAELREAALHLATYDGWSSGSRLDTAITTAVDDLNLEEASYQPLRAKPWDPAERLDDGSAGFKEVMIFGGPPPVTAYFEGGILNFVFAEMWNRPGLDQRARRWITLVGVANSAASVPIRSHVWSAMASGNASAVEMQEFVLQYAIHAGWPKASVVQSAVLEQAARVEKNLPFEI